MHKITKSLEKDHYAKYVPSDFCLLNTTAKITTQGQEILLKDFKTQ
jgi:hypothetical protein